MLICSKATNKHNLIFLSFYLYNRLNYQNIYSIIHNKSRAFYRIKSIILLSLIKSNHYFSEDLSYQIK